MSPSSSSGPPRRASRAKSAKRPKRSTSAKSANSAQSAKTAKKPKRSSSAKASKARTQGTSRSRVRNERASRATARQLRSRDAASLADRQSNSLSGLSEQLVNRILKPLGLVVLSREGIAGTVGEAADRGRLTHSDADQLVGQLVQLGRQQTEELLSDLEQTLGRGRQQLDVATRRARRVTPDRIIRGADRARRTIGVGPSFPILGYEDLTVAQIQSRLRHLSDPELRKVRDHERRNAQRKSLLRAIEKALG
jgi:hypothetical protein